MFLAKSKPLLQLVDISRTRSLHTFGACFAHWNKDWVPGPYPKTKEEREAAAKKYGMHPNEYEPYPDDGTGFGDYPKLPYKGVALRDPFYPYDLPDLKRNWQEPIHIDIQLIGEDRTTAGEKTRYSLLNMFLTFVGVFGTLFALSCYSGYKVFHPVMEKQYPYANKKAYYSFERVN